MTQLLVDMAVISATTSVGVLIVDDNRLLVLQGCRERGTPREGWPQGSRQVHWPFAGGQARKLVG
jgi:hypothetical protein